MTSFAPNIELLYTEHANYADRIRAAAKDGFTSVEMWMTSMQNLDELAAAAKESGVTITSTLAEPRFSFTMPGVDLNVFYEGLAGSIERAHKLGCRRVVLGSGMGFPGKKRQAQLDELVTVFRQATAMATDADIELVLEPVNTRVDHPGALLDRTSEAAYIARQVASPNFKVLYDIYHSVVEGEDPAQQLKDNADVIGYIQLADAPGRGEPGSGKIEWASVLGAVDASGYAGVVGLEYYPTKETTASLTYLRSL